MIYIAAPYYSPYPCITPMFFHPVVKLHELPNDFAFWGDLSLDLLKRCDEMHLLKLEGWSVSRGVKEELDFCHKNGIKVSYVE
jgi:hypothetical protein